MSIAIGNQPTSNYGTVAIKNLVREDLGAARFEAAFRGLRELYPNNPAVTKLEIAYTSMERDVRLNVEDENEIGLLRNKISFDVLGLLDNPNHLLISVPPQPLTQEPVNLHPVVAPSIPDRLFS